MGVWDVQGEPEQAHSLASLAQSASSWSTNNHYSIALQNCITKYYVFINACLVLIDCFDSLHSQYQTHYKVLGATGAGLTDEELEMRPDLKNIFGP